MIIKNVTVYTMEDDTGVIENGYVEINDGKIVKVGECTDGTPCGFLFPGFIDGHTHIGMVEDSLTFEGDDLNETGEPITPQLRGVDSINPMDRCFREALEAGITCVAAGPGSANPIAGQFCIMKTHGKRVDSMLVREKAAVKFALGENPKGVYHGKNQMPETRMASAALIRETLFKAKKYAEDLDKYNNADPEDDIDRPEFDIKLESLVPLIKKEIPAHFHAHRADDIFTAIRIAKEFDIDYVIVHCTEGYLVADELKKDGVRAFCGPNLSDRSKPELKNLSFANPGVLAKEGLEVGITTDHPVIPIKYLALCAALAVKEGMSREDAYKALTINPAKILGVDHKVGSIKVGKDADLVLFDKDPFDIFSEVKSVWINGEKVK